MEHPSTASARSTPSGAATDRRLLGATPETLVHLDGKNLVTAAIAGTAPRKADPEDDRGEAAQLVASRKEQREHRLVVRAMQEALGPLCRRLTIDTSPIVRKLSLMQHLETPIRGELHEALHVLDLVQALHPTPAVAGWPTQDAIDWLRDTSPWTAVGTLAPWAGFRPTVAGTSWWHCAVRWCAATRPGPMPARASPTDPFRRQNGMRPP